MYWTDRPFIIKMAAYIMVSNHTARRQHYGCIAMQAIPITQGIHWKTEDTLESYDHGTDVLMVTWSKLKLLSQYGRAHGDMIEVFKYLHGAYSVSQCPLTLDGNPAGTQAHSLRLKKFWCTRSTFSKVFSHRVTEVWNRLPYAVVTAQTLNSFKHWLDTNWRHFQHTLKTF